MLQVIIKEGNTVPFLDVEIRIDSNKFETKVYRKPTNTNVVMNFEAISPTKWKVALIKCFLRRASRIVSTEALLDKEIQHIKNMFRANSYPPAFVDNTIKDFMRAKFPSKQPPNNVDDNISTTQYFVLPYVGKPSEKLCKRIHTELQQHGIKVRPAYRTTKVQSYFNLKSAIPPLFKADVVYQFKCPREEGSHQDTYIGRHNVSFFKGFQTIF